MAGVDQEGRISRLDRRDILSHLYQLVGSINANFGSILTTPVHFLLSPLSVENLVCLYALADIAVITPLRWASFYSFVTEVLVDPYFLSMIDLFLLCPRRNSRRESLSWTAYEFVLCQTYTNKGVLILSEFSGSAQSLGAAAICVNPWDSNALATAIHDALIMKNEVGG